MNKKDFEYNGKYKWHDLETETKIIKKDEWGNESIKISHDFEMTYAYKYWLKYDKPIIDNIKEYYEIKKRCQYQLMKYGDIESIDEMRLKYLKKQIINALSEKKSFNLNKYKPEWLKEFLGIEV